MLPFHGQNKYWDNFSNTIFIKKKKQRPVGLERHKGEKLWQILFITIVYLTQQVE